MVFAALTLVATLAFAAGPFLVPQFGGFDPDLFPVPQVRPEVQPAGYAFAIWGPIYLWLLISAGFGVLRRARDPDWAEMRPALLVSLVIGAAWLPVAETAPLLSAFMLWAMWLAGIVALFRAPALDRGLAAWPIGLYVGWLSAAASVGTGINLAGFGVLDGRVTAFSMLALATIIAGIVQARLGRTPTYGLAVVWAFVGVYVANATRAPDVAGVAAAGALALGALTLVSAYREVRGA